MDKMVRLFVTAFLVGTPLWLVLYVVLFPWPDDPHFAVQPGAKGTPSRAIPMSNVICVCLPTSV